MNTIAAIQKTVLMRPVTSRRSSRCRARAPRKEDGLLFRLSMRVIGRKVLPSVTCVRWAFVGCVDGCEGDRCFLASGGQRRKMRAVSWEWHSRSLSGLRRQFPQRKGCERTISEPRCVPADARFFGQHLHQRPLVFCCRHHRSLEIKHRLLIDADEPLMRMREIEDEHDDHADEQREEEVSEAGAHAFRT